MLSECPAKKVGKEKRRSVSVNKVNAKTTEADPLSKAKKKKRFRNGKGPKKTSAKCKPLVFSFG